MKNECENQIGALKAKVQAQNKTFETVLTEKQAEINSARSIFEAEKEKVINEVQADGLRKQQQMLVDFNQAQELLKAKITDLASERDELEQKYRNRESRPEDLEKIRQYDFLLG